MRLADLRVEGDTVLIIETAVVQSHLRASN
jgi:hypothetical protein